MGLDELSKDALYEMAQDANIEGRGKMTKTELVAALEEVDTQNHEEAYAAPAPAQPSAIGMTEAVLGMPCRLCGAVNVVKASAGTPLEFTCGECGANNGPYAVVAAD